MASTPLHPNPRWQYFFEDEPKKGWLDPWISHRAALRMAEMFPESPHVRQATNWRVSDFSGWVHMLYVGSTMKGRLWEGTEGHAQVSASRRLGSSKHRVDPPSNKGWTCVHDDLKGTSDQNYSISALTINERPFVGCPDLVFVDSSGTAALILEIKTTDAKLPYGGWPDLRAQLWAYSRIDEWANIPNVQLAAEIWDKSGTRLRRTYQWSREDDRIQKGGEEMFAAYVEAVARSPRSPDASAT